MNLIISLLYAPIIFYALKNFELKIVALILGLFSFIWFLVSIKKGLKEYLFPLFYLNVSFFAYFLNNVLLLKLLPLFISLFISLFILYSYLTKNSFIFIFLAKFKKTIKEEEKTYIQKSTLFWFFIALINVLIHTYIIFIDNMVYWTIYASIGWYFPFIVGGLLQFIHRYIYFKKSPYA